MDARQESRWLGAGGIACSLLGAGAVPLWPRAAAPLVALGVGVVLFAGVRWMVGVARGELPYWRPAWRLRFEADGPWPFRRLVPLPDAARVAYEQTLNSLAAKAAERLSRSVLGWYAAVLTNDGRTALYGVRPPSRVRERIDPAELKRCSFSEDAATLSYTGEDRPAYTDLAIGRADLKRRIREIRSWEVAAAD